MDARQLASQLLAEMEDEQNIQRERQTEPDPPYSAQIERSEVSHHEVRIYKLVYQSTKWFTNKEIANQLSMPGRTVRQHTLRFVKLGLLDQANVFPGRRFRWSTKSGGRNIAYVQRLQHAAGVFDGEATVTKKN